MICSLHLFLCQSTISRSSSCNGRTITGLIVKESFGRTVLKENECTSVQGTDMNAITFDRTVCYGLEYVLITNHEFIYLQEQAKHVINGQIKYYGAHPLILGVIHLTTIDLSSFSQQGEKNGLNAISSPHAPKL